ncbi:MAB_1171c family putative transporter [Sphaerisporangium sp. NPDC005289]|uniref:MAB_1171c family putative transporter n=1 Tax=Sphaerisporangium sp. NPDC005289 TaxID=3155247 RepID=UPI00339E1EAF
MISTLLAAQRDHRSLNALRPLWRHLTGAVPQVILFTPPSRLTDLASLTDLRLRLLRRTIEIHDARLALRGYVTDEDYQWIQDTLTGRGLAGEQLDAAVEAVWLTAAVTAKHRGTAFTPPSARPAHGGSDLPSEVRWLRLIEHARRSRAAATVLHELDQRMAKRQR